MYIESANIPKQHSEPAFGTPFSSSTSFEPNKNDKRTSQMNNEQ